MRERSSNWQVTSSKYKKALGISKCRCGMRGKKLNLLQTAGIQQNGAFAFHLNTCQLEHLNTAFKF